METKARASLMMAWSRREWIQAVGLGFAGVGGLGRGVLADETLKDIACRSVHLAYVSEPCLAFYNTCQPTTSAAGTYFCVCGWDAGYYGIQQLANGKKVLLFSVWDSDSDDPNAAREDERVKVVHQDPRVRVKRFGGEGSGGQSFFDLDWKLDETYRFLVAFGREGHRATYANWLFEPADQQWKKLVTFSVPSQRTALQGLYSFVEDFRRNRESAQQTRRAQFGPAAAMTKPGPWQFLRQARFTADANPVLNIDARVIDTRFELATGGDITNAHVKLKEMLELASDVAIALPDDFPRL